MHYDSQFSGWHALFVATGEEEKVSERLKYRFHDEYSILVPKRKVRERRNGSWIYATRLLFPGYVLIKGEIDPAAYYKFKNVPGLIGFLKSGSTILDIDYHEMMVLSRLISNSETIDFSSIMLEDGRVRVVEGPLLSLEGYIINVDLRKGRAKVMLNFLGDVRTVDLGVSVLRPA